MIHEKVRLKLCIWMVATLACACVALELWGICAYREGDRCWWQPEGSVCAGQPDGTYCSKSCLPFTYGFGTCWFTGNSEEECVCEEFELTVEKKLGVCTNYNCVNLKLYDIYTTTGLFSRDVSPCND